jgi:hypothetical protein
MRVPAAGGEPIRLTSSGTGDQLDGFPHVLPGSKSVLFTTYEGRDSIGANAAANYGMSRRGDLVYVPGGLTVGSNVQRTLVWVDRDGKESPIPAPPRAYATPRLSPNGRRVVLDVRDQANDIWIWDLQRPLLSSLNRDPAQDMSPIPQSGWLPDFRESDQGRRDVLGRPAVTDPSHTLLRRLHDSWSRSAGLRRSCGRAAFSDDQGTGRGALSST